MKFQGPLFRDHCPICTVPVFIEVAMFGHNKASGLSLKDDRPYTVLMYIYRHIFVTTRPDVFIKGVCPGGVTVYASRTYKNILLQSTIMYITPDYDKCHQGYMWQ